jgi:molybdenum cofactor cytidylyltransferase
LARQYGGPLWLAASTHLAVEQARQAGRHIVLAPGATLPEIEPAEGSALFSGPAGEDGRTAGLEPGQLAELHRRAGDFPLLIEADGARRRPLKAPAAHEPALPGFVDTVVVVAGWGGVGRPLAEETVHRQQVYAGLSGLALGEPVTPEALAAVLAHPQGGRKNVPDAARLQALLNQCDDPAKAAAAAALAPSLLEAGYAAVIPAHLESPAEEGQVWSVRERAAGIVLAAGGSQRFGQPKQLLTWRGRPFVRSVCETALAAGLDPVVAVLGAYSHEVEVALADLPVSLAQNSHWAEGQSTSARAGLAALPPNAGAAVFLLADQPQVPPELIAALVERRSLTGHPLIAPLVDGRRGNPVLFGWETFAEFVNLSGDEGGRALFRRYDADYIPWLDPAAALDVDTPADYARLLKYEE